MVRHDDDDDDDDFSNKNYTPLYIGLQFYFCQLSINTVAIGNMWYLIIWNLIVYHSIRNKKIILFFTKKRNNLFEWKEYLWDIL